MQFDFVTDLNDITAEQWDALSANHYPFLQHAFLNGLERSNAVGENTGWQPFHLIAKDDKTLEIVCAMPLYLKSHSYGEYVFDWAWADAYQRNGFQYYPKLLAAIPFTPVSGPRLLCKDDTQLPLLWPQIENALIEQCEQLGLSSCHLLYPTQELAERCESDHWIKRESTQFQWFNRDYQSFEGFLETFASRKRKNVRKERAKVQKHGIKINRYTGDELTEERLRFFTDCYMQTYLKRSGHTGYLNQDTFELWRQSLANNMLLVTAEDNERPIAAALYFFDGSGLYGRYWGALQEVDGLHFECCYYQGIEFCIERNLPLFNPGTQGEHKIQRGFEPIACHSRHYIAHPAFKNAISQFTLQERAHNKAYREEAATLLPFKKTG